MSKPKVSIIIPAYNLNGYIHKCIESVCKQTYSNMEILVIDDGSTDITPQILDEFALSDNRIIVIHKVNEGVSIARNTGIEHATGTYYFFFDGDDFMEPHTVENMVHIAEEKEVDSVIYGYYRYKEGKIIDKNLPKFDKEVYAGEEILISVIPAFIGVSYEHINNFICHVPGSLYVENPALWRCMVSADIIHKEKLRFDQNLKVGEDTIFISEYLSYSQRCYIEQRCYYYLVIRETSTIYVYEKNVLSKLEGKMKLLTARLDLTKKVLNRTGKDIGDTWKGTIVMSVIELAFLFGTGNAEISWMRRMKQWKIYAKNKEVQKIVHDFPLKHHFGVLVVPFLLLKWHCYGILFLATTLLRKVGYQFNRN